MKSFFFVLLMTFQFFMGTTCSQVDCRKQVLGDFLINKAPEILKFAHPGAGFKKGLLRGESLIEIQYIAPSSQSPETLTVRLKMDADFKKIESFSSVDSGSVQAFAVGDFLNQALNHIPGLSELDPQAKQSLNPRHWVSVYLDSQWQNHLDVFSCD